MAGGNGTRLKILTKDKCKPMVNILGSYRIFDFVASNIVNTEIPVSLIAAQFKSISLSKYIREAKPLWSKSETYFEIIDPNMDEDISEFAGTADSVRKCVNRIDKYRPDVILVLGADHIYFMDYRDPIIQHTKKDADITIMTNVIPDSKVADFGIVKIDKTGKIIDFAEKPEDRRIIDNFRLTSEQKKQFGIDDPNMNFLASMGNYIFNWSKLKAFLDSDGLDFGKDIIPAIRDKSGLMYAYIFSGYWRDVGRIQDYYNCNIEFAGNPLDLLKYWLRVREGSLDPPEIVNGASIHSSIISYGAKVGKQSNITNSVLGDGIAVERNCILDNCILLGSSMGDSINTELIGRNSRLDSVILSRNVCVGKDVEISPNNGTPEERSEILIKAGLKPYKECVNGEIEGDFYIEPETGILVIGEQPNPGSQNPTLPEGLRC